MTSKSIQSPWTTTLLPYCEIASVHHFSHFSSCMALFIYLASSFRLWFSTVAERCNTCAGKVWAELPSETSHFFFLPTRSTCLSHPKSESSLKQNNQSAVFKLHFRLKSKIHYKDKLVTRERMNIKRFCVYLSMILQLRKWEEDENDSLIPSFLVYFYVKF